MQQTHLRLLSSSSAASRCSISRHADNYSCIRIRVVKTKDECYTRLRLLLQRRQLLLHFRQPPLRRSALLLGRRRSLLQLPQLGLVLR